MWRWRNLIVSVFVVSLVFLTSIPTHAGTFKIRIVEDKGTLMPGALALEGALVILASPLPLALVATEEQVIVQPVGTPFARIFNIYPDFVDVPQPLESTQLVDFPWFMAADIGQGIGPLPVGSVALAAALIGPSTGTRFPATITPVSDLATLPSSSANDLLVQWNLAALSGTTGNFFLMQASMPVTEFVPESDSMMLLGAGLPMVVAFLRRRRRKINQELLSPL